MSFRFPFAGLIITGGSGTATSIETFPVDADATCTIPPFPEPGNLSSFSSSYSPPKGEPTTPSLSLKTAVNWSPAEGVAPRSLASLGAVAKIIGLTMRHRGEIWSSCHINPFSARRGGTMQLWWFFQMRRSSWLAGHTPAAETPVKLWKVSLIGKYIKQ